jgi:hypothetical protein
MISNRLWICTIQIRIRTASTVSFFIPTVFYFDLPPLADLGGTVEYNTAIRLRNLNIYICFGTRTSLFKSANEYSIS